MTRTFTQWAQAGTMALALLAGTAFGQNTPTVRNCGTMEHLEHLEAEHPGTLEKIRMGEERTQRYLQDRAAGRVAAVTVTIPVVVHVLYRTAAENISDAQIQSQINILNADFARLNSDAGRVPSLFAGVAAGSGIQFCLARTDANGNPTTGILRVPTTRTSFGTTGDPIKFASSGGSNAWDTQRYLNIWVGTLSNSLLGYAQFPNSGSASTDGVVVLNTAFGNTGTAAAPFNLGRTATHEVGHWLNLRHIWGDANCGNDFVTDTPTQQTSNVGCPAFPKPTCGNTSDQWMNYMDYTDDRCMYMFSAGQVARMEATFATGGGRSTFLTTSACASTPPPACTTPTGLSATSITQTGATLGWAAVTGAANYTVSYNATGGTSTTLTVTGTSTVLTGLVASTAYSYRVTANCTSGSSSAATGSFTTLGTNTITYCANPGGSTADEWLAFVGLGAISNTSGGQNTAGYQDFTNLATNLLPGTRYTINYQAGFRSGYSATEYYRVWIDYNRDGDFLDANEQVVSRSSNSSARLSSAFTVPTGVSLGRTRMRVVMKYGSHLTAACTNFTNSWGQVEDYTVILGSGTGREMASTSLEATVAPNPAADVAAVSATLPTGTQMATLRLLDLAGRQVWTATAEAPQSQLSYELPVRDLKAGMYILQVEASGLKKALRFTVE